MVAVNKPGIFTILASLPVAAAKGIYIAATLASAVFFGWLAWRLKKGAPAKAVFRLLVVWISGAVLLVSTIFPVLWVVDFLAFQIWLAGLFLIPGFFKRFRLLVQGLLGDAPARWRRSVAERVGTRFRESTLNFWITGVRSWWDAVADRLMARFRETRCNTWLAGLRSWWDTVPEEQKRLVELVVGTGLLVCMANYKVR
ncbi:MAG TPA: hypothetical protein DCY27_07710 [Desulfobacterales bacterium]|nr:hypothetical protein [Desulfobacterales bacterium]